MFEDDDKADPIVIGCLEAAYASLGIEMKVMHERLVVDPKGDINRWEAVLDAYPLAHRLYIGLAGAPSSAFYAALYSGAKSRNLDEPELIRDMLDDDAHDDLDLLANARIRAILRAERDKSPRPVFATGIEEALDGYVGGRS